ncbi:MAG: ABC transporter substrate-binding protein [Bacillota bacterium]
MRNKKWFAVLTVFMLLAFILAGCGGSSTDGNTDGTNGTESIKVAYAGPMTGNNASYGEDQMAGMKMAVEEINEAGGFQAGPLKGAKIEIVGPYDDRSDPTEAANIAQKIVDDESVFAYFGNVNSSCSLAAAPILSRANLTMINSYSSNPKLTELGYTNVFRVILDDNSQAADIARILVENFGKKNLAAVWANDDYGRGLADAFKVAVPNLGANLVVDYSFTAGDADFSVLVTQMKDKKVDGIALLTTYSDGALVLKQSKAAGLDVGKGITVVGTTSNASEDFMKIGGDATEGTYLAAIWDPRLNNSLVQNFNKIYEEKYGRLPSEAVAVAYDAMKVFQKAVESGADSRETLAEHMRKTKDFEGVTGKITFNENGQAVNKESVLLVVKDGMFVPNE